MSTPVPSGMDKILDNLDRRVHRVEQIATSPALVAGASQSNEFPDGVIIGVGDGAVTVDSTPPLPVTDVTVGVGAYFDDIFADVEWTPVVPEPEEGEIVAAPFSFDVEYALKNGLDDYTLINVYNTMATNYRLTNLQPNTDYGVRVIPVNGIGIRSEDTPDFTDFTTEADTTVPAQITGVVVARGATTVVVKFSPSSELDVANGKGVYEVEIDTSAGFNTANLRNMRNDANVVAFNDILTEGTWIARVRAIDSSGNAGPWSATSSIFAGAVNDSMIVADLSASKITAGFLSAARIQAGTLTADKLTTSSLTTADITLAGGSFKVGSPPTNGILFNSQGLRAYVGGSTTFILDSSGSATFSGTLSGNSIVGASISGSTITGGTITGSLYKTATSGARIELETVPSGSGQSAFTSQKFYTGQTGGGAGPGTLFGGFDTTNTAGYIRMQAPRPVSGQFPGTLELRSGADAGPVTTASSAALDAGGSSVAVYRMLNDTPISTVGVLIQCNGEVKINNASGSPLFRCSRPAAFDSNLGVTGTSFLTDVTCQILNCTDLMIDSIMYQPDVNGYLHAV